MTPSTFSSVATATYRNHARCQPRVEISHVLEEQQQPDSIAAFRLSVAARLGRDEGAGSRLRLYRGCVTRLMHLSRTLSSQLRYHDSSVVTMMAQLTGPTFPYRFGFRPTSYFASRVRNAAQVLFQKRNRCLESLTGILLIPVRTPCSCTSNMAIGRHLSAGPASTT
jgi:hypothetical protein